MLVQEGIIQESVTVSEVNTWHLVAILYETFKSVYIGTVDNQVYLKVQKPEKDKNEEPSFWKVSGSNLQDAISRAVALAWEVFPEDTKKVLEALKQHI